MSEIVVKTENLYKQYRLGAIGGRTLQGDLQSWFAKVRGKEDPNLKLGQEAINRNASFYALSDVNLEVKKGDTMGLIGGNGAGKSTLLKVLSRVTAPTKGKVYMKGRVSSMLEVGTGFHPELTGRDNVYLNGAILGMSKTEVSRKFDEIVEFAGLEKFIDTPVKRYSSGMYVKLAFSVAAHLDSEILIMDEVLAVGDVKFQQRCLGKMGDVADKEGRTVIYVSHNMNTIRQLCNRCVVLEEGHCVYNGDVSNAISYYLDTVSETFVYKDFSDRKGKIEGFNKVVIQSIRVEDKEEASFERYEEPIITLKCKADRDVEGIYFRMETDYVDSTKAGTSLSDKPVSFKAGEVKDIKCKLHIGNLAPGKYYAAILAYETSSFGSYNVIDRVFPALTFEIKDKYDKQDIVWSHLYFGHVKLGDIEILE